MSHENTNWGQSVAGVVIRDGKVLLARHTYGRGNGLLIDFDFKFSYTDKHLVPTWHQVLCHRNCLW